MKFLLVPLLIVGMFVSFTAALLAMLFFTETVESPEELKKILMGQVDTTKISDEFIDPEDRLGELFREADQYRTLYETERRRNEEVADSLAVVVAKIKTDSLALAQREAALDSAAKGASVRLRQANLKDLAKFYAKIKAASAAEILEAEALSDTSTAMLMRLLPPQQMAKIMQSMTPEYAGGITKLMEELKQHIDEGEIPGGLRGGITKLMEELKQVEAQGQE